MSPHRIETATGDRRLIRVLEAAEMLDMDPATVRRWIHNDTIKGYRVGPRSWRVDRAEIDSTLTPVEIARNGGGRNVD